MICRSCRSDQTEMFLDLGPQPHCNTLVNPGDPDPSKHPLRLWFCHACTLVQIDHTIPKEEMFSDAYPYVSGTTETLVEHFRQSALRLTDLYLSDDDLVVDIGSNDGTWLAQYAPEIRCLGVEPSDLAITARDNGQPTLKAFFDENTALMILDEMGPAKLITAAGVFFHLEDIHGVIRGIKHLLADDGVLVIQALYLGSIMENVAFDQIYHEHLCYFTLQSLDALLRPHGLFITESALWNIHGGTIEVHVSKQTKHSHPDWFRHDIAKYEAIKEMDTIEPYREFARNVKSLVDELRTEILLRVAKRETIYAYGAPAKGATLLNTIGIGPDMIACAVEKNPRKFGKLMPGCRIPIVDEDEASSPDVYLLLAWNFASEILTKEHVFTESGGEFIIPIPRVQIVGR